jgi:hypothetical protein
VPRILATLAVCFAGLLRVAITAAQILAARLQFIPDFFRFDETLGATALHAVRPARVWAPTLSRPLTCASAPDPLGRKGPRLLVP